MRLKLAFFLLFISLTLFAQPLPQSVDNSILKYFPPIISQIGGSCAQASSIGYVFTYEMNRLLDRDASLPQNRFSYLFAWNFINNGEDVGSFNTDGYTLAYTNGMMTESDFPTQTSPYQFKWASGYNKYINSFQYRVKKYEYLDLKTTDDIENLKRYLYNKREEGKVGGIVVLSSAAGGWSFNNNYVGPSSTGYKSLLTSLPTSGGHAMTIVGYDDAVEFIAPNGSKHFGAFIVVNSYGLWYHDRGRFYLPYYFFLNSRDRSVLSDSVTALFVYHVESPLIVFKVGLTYSSRNDLSFSIGVADKPYSEAPQHCYTMFMAGKQGGDNPMQGAAASEEMEIAFNFSDFVGRLSGYKEPKFFLTVNRNEVGKLGSGTINHFSILDYRKNPNAPTEYYCSDINRTPLKKGENLFGVATTPLKTTSASKSLWRENKESIKRGTFLLKTAKGNYAKLKFVKYDRTTGRATIKYGYSPNGSRNLNTNE